MHFHKLSPAAQNILTNRLVYVKKDEEFKKTCPNASLVFPDWTAQTCQAIYGEPDPRKLLASRIQTPGFFLTSYAETDEPVSIYELTGDIFIFSDTIDEGIFLFTTQKPKPIKL